MVRMIFGITAPNPGEELDTMTIFGRFNRRNPGLNTSMWHLIKDWPENGSATRVRLLVRMDAASRAFIAANKFKLKYNAKKIPFDDYNPRKFRNGGIAFIKGRQ